MLSLKITLLLSPYSGLTIIAMKSSAWGPLGQFYRDLLRSRL